MRQRNRGMRAAALALALGLIVAACGADEPEEVADPDPAEPEAEEPEEPEETEEAEEPEAEGGHFEGETITFLIGRGPGGGFDLYARAIGPFLAEELGAEAVFENMGGAGGALAESEIANVLPADCQTVGIMGPRGTIPAQMIGESEAIRFDVREDFDFIGRLAAEPQIWSAGEHTGYESVEDVLEVGSFSSGASGSSSVGAINAIAIEAAFDLDWDLVIGFESGAEARLEVERGGLDGIVIDAPSLLPDMEAGIINPLLVLGFDTPTGYEDFDVPLVGDMEDLVDEEGMALLNTTARLAELARGFFVREGCPEEKLAEMRAAYDRMVERDDFAAAMEEAGSPVDPMGGEDFEQLIVDTFDEMPEAFLDAIREAEED